mgnify:CR=1 FL=1
MVCRHNKLYSNHSYPVVFQNKRSKVNLHCYQNQCVDETDLSMVHRFIIADNFIIFFTCKSFPACINVDGLSNILTNHTKNIFRYCRINRYSLNIRCILGIRLFTFCACLNRHHSISEYELESYVVFLLPLM